MIRIQALVFCLWCYSTAYTQSSIRAIYIIHSDANYLYHDKEGHALNAAEEILEQSFSMGKNLKNGEIFIFHQKPSENFLFFPHDNGEFFHYRNGLKIQELTYSRRNFPAFVPEAELIKKYSESSSDNIKNIFLYYGHRIPQKNTSGYHYSDPETEFGIPIFVEGVKHFITSLQETRFDLIVLSTCRNGNYETARALSPSAEYLIASPSDIHLSYMNSETLVNLTSINTIEDLALQFAENAFTIMTQTVNTEISISVYDLNKISLNNEKVFGEGVTNFYRAPFFGKKLSCKQK